MRWVTRRRPKIDRLASPWLISRFVDPQAQFLFVPEAEVCSTAAATGATPFDVPSGTPGADLVHPPGGTSFDAIRTRFALHDPALERIAAIVRDADNDNRFGLVPEALGLRAISLGLARSVRDDQERLAYGLVLYDALYQFVSKEEERASVLGEMLTWMSRFRERRSLNDLSDHLLSDVGLTRDQAEREVAKPFWQP